MILEARRSIYYQRFIMPQKLKAKVPEYLTAIYKKGKVTLRSLTKILLKSQHV